MTNPLSEYHPNSEGYACIGELQPYDTKNPQHPAGFFEACTKCGAFFESGELIMYNQDAAEQAIQDEKEN